MLVEAWAGRGNQSTEAPTRRGASSVVYRQAVYRQATIARDLLFSLN